MARVTVEDCISIVPNRYELVLMAAQRARDISTGAAPTVDRDNDKNTVIALREIADQTVSLDDVRHHIVHGVNRTADATEEDALLRAVALEGLSPETTTNATAIAIEETVFEGIAPAPDAEFAGDDFSAEEGMDAADVQPAGGDSFAEETI
jgi:DNA-directed RNA polymerase subunit omega